MTAPLGPTQRFVSGTVIKAAEYAGSIAGAPVTQRIVAGTANALVDNKVGRWGAGQVDNIADKVASAPAVQQAAAKAEGLVTNVIKASPVVKDLAVGLFSKVRTFIRAANLKSPPVKAFQMGEDALETIQSGGTIKRAIQDTIGNLRDIHEAVKPGNNAPSGESLQEAFGFGHHALEMLNTGKTAEELIEDTKAGLKILEDTLKTPASTKPDVQSIELKAKVLGIELKASDNEHFANSALSAIIKMNSKGIEVPRLRLSKTFPKVEGYTDKGHTNHDTMPISKMVAFFNADANWADAAKPAGIAYTQKWKTTSSPEHEIYHSVGRTMYNGKAGNEKLVKSNAMPEAQRLKIQAMASIIETPQDFMGEMFAHIMVNGHQKEMEPHYVTFRDWGGQLPRDFMPAGQSLPLPTRPLPKAPSPLDAKA